MKSSLRACVGGVMVAMLIATTGVVRSQPAAEPDIDRIFSRFSDTTPGCAVGVDVNGRTTLAKAYGMADLEHDVKNTPETIFEAGSISKQFTAASMLLLAKEGKLSLD